MLNLLKGIVGSEFIVTFVMSSEKMAYVEQLKLIIMARINDLKKVRVFQALFELVDSGNSPFIHPKSLSSFKVEFGVENTHSGIGGVKVNASYYDSVHGKFVFSFWGVFDHKYDVCFFKSVQIDREFSASVLLSINNYKINRPWLLDEEGEGDACAAQGGVCPEVADVDSAHSKKNVRL